jgi:hypothetical protein
MVSLGCCMVSTFGLCIKGSSCTIVLHAVGSSCTIVLHAVGSSCILMSHLCCLTDPGSCTVCDVEEGMLAQCSHCGTFKHLNCFYPHRLSLQWRGRHVFCSQECAVMGPHVRFATAAQVEHVHVTPPKTPELQHPKRVKFHCAPCIDLTL